MYLFCVVLGGVRVCKMYLICVLLGGVIELNLEQDGIFSALSTMLLEVPDGHGIGVELRGEAVTLGCKKNRVTRLCSQK